MKIIIKTKNLEASESLNIFAEKKFLTLEKFIKILEKEDAKAVGGKKTLAEIIVEIEKETNHHKKGDIYRVKGQVIFSGKNIVSDEVADDIFVAITKSKEELKNEIEKYKVKKIDKTRRQQRKSKEKNKIVT